MNEVKKFQITNLLNAKKQELGLTEATIGGKIGINAATINHILSLRYEKEPQLVSDRQFEKVAQWLGMNDEWVVNKNDFNFKKVQTLCDHARIKSDSYAISAPPGFSKTEAAKDYSKRRDVFFISCQAHWTKKVFMQEVVRSMGISDKGETINDLVERLFDSLGRRQNPLIIIDEADKLNDNIFQFFITFYNGTNMKCGFLFMGSIFFEERVLKGVRRNRQGYAEFYSRIGREFIKLRNFDNRRLSEICRLNGLTDEVQIQEIINKSENDLRHLKRMVESRKLDNSLASEKEASNGLSKNRKEDVIA